MTYPVVEIIPSLKDELQKSSILILHAPPGAGKSTIVPLHLMDESWLDQKKIIMLEPRRLAARSVAIRMATLLNEDIGKQVGYRVRFENRISDKTRIEVVTEGILTRMIQSNNALEGVGLVIFDEFHERSLQSDLALALCLQLQQFLRSDLRILIMSATLETQKISAMLNNVPVISSTGKQFPVTLNYAGYDDTVPLSTYVSRTVLKIANEVDGDILVFLPGTGDIMRTKDILENSGVKASIHPLYGDLPFTKQQEAILPHAAGARKIVLATSIAETSLTIEGIRIIVDSGFSRVPRFDPRSGLTRLETIRVAKDSADQRSGRAGRLGPGLCYRLWSEHVQRNLADHRNPEILEADLAPLVLELCAWGVQNINEMTWMTSPPAGAVRQAFELLRQLDAIDDENKITTRGKKMVQLPTHPRIAHMLLECEDTIWKLQLATDVAALLEERDPLPKESGADLSLRVTTLRRWRAGERVVAELAILKRIERLANSWRRYFTVKEENSRVDDYAVGEMIMLAYPERIARQSSKNSQHFKLSTGRSVALADHDPLVREPWLAIAHLDFGIKQGKIFLAAPLDEGALEQHALDHAIVEWDKEREMVVASLERRVGNLILKSNKLPAINSAKRIQVLCDLVRNEGLQILGWNEKQCRWQSRILCLRSWRPDEPWPNVDDDVLLENLDEWLPLYLGDCVKLSDLQKLDLNSILLNMLPWEMQQKLERYAPEKLEMPSGSWIQVKYFKDGSPPVLEVRLQEVFGLLETPSLNEGKIKILIHLLSPGYKPVQVTQDLKSFWTTAYHEVRKELKRRYPKHSWPEDPWTAKAVRGVVKKRN